MAYSEFGSEGSVSAGSLVDELLESEGGFARGPERALLSALLFDGVQNYMNYCCAPSAAEREKYSEAYSWVNRQRHEYVFSFDSVCEALGIDPNFLRLGLIHAAALHGPDWVRRRRNF